MGTDAPAITTDTAIDVDSCRMVYPGGRAALDGVSLTVPRGGWLALLGPNGSGKSTLLKIIGTLMRPTEGHVHVLGLDLDDAVQVRAIRSQLGLAFQSPALDPLLTIRENLIAAAALVGLSGSTARERAEEVATQLGVADRLGERVSRLSGGLMRRADLARAILSRPRLLLLDEPTTGLDFRARAEFFESLYHAWQSTAGLTILMTTHLMDEAERAQRVVLMHKGKIVGDGEPGALRRALGGTVIRCRAEGPRAAQVEDMLKGRGLTVTTEPGGAGTPTLVARGSQGQASEAARELMLAGVPLEIGPPTLGDVYLSFTGETLAPDTPPAPPTPSTRRGRHR